jgi:hypothetical protein
MLINPMLRLGKGSTMMSQAGEIILSDQASTLQRSPLEALMGLVGTFGRCLRPVSVDGISTGRKLGGHEESS